MTPEMMDGLATFLVVSAVSGVIAVIVAVALRIFKIAREGVQSSPALLNALKYAAEFGAIAVEKLDEAGFFDPLIAEGKDKSNAKLDMAVDKGVQVLESLALNMFKIKINIDEAAIRLLVRDAVQKYVWENPYIFFASRAEQKALEEIITKE